MSNSTGAGGDDEKQEYSGDNFAYFALSFVTCVAIPYTISLVRLRSARSADAKRKAAATCQCAGCVKKRADAVLADTKWNVRDAIKWAICAALWLAWLAALYVVITTAPSSAAASGGFDPFKILDIDSGATDAEIKRAYKKMTVKWHPDKNRDQAEVAEQMFIAVTRAYKTLTDEIAKKNWVEYGNPDGPQGFSMGIALPAWLIDRSNTYLVLVVYILLVLVVLPYGAVSLWNRWKSLAPNEVMYETMYLYGRKLKVGLTYKPMLELIAGASEYSTLPLRAGDDKGVKTIVDQLQVVDRDQRLSPKIVEDEDLRKIGYVLKTQMLIYAHLNRLHGSLTPQLQADLATVLDKAPMLANGMLSMLQQMGRGQVPYPLVDNAMKVGQCIVQGVWPNQELQQLPHVTDSLVKALVKAKIKTLDQLISLPADQRRRMLVGADVKERGDTAFITNAQAADVESLLTRMPLHIAVNGQVKVEDEIAFISPGSVVSLFVTCERTTAEDAKARTKINAADADNVEALIAAGVKLKGSAARVATIAAKNALKSPSSKSEKSENSEVSATDDDEDDDWQPDTNEQPRFVDLGKIDAHCPFLPAEHGERHWLFLVDQRNFVQGSIKKTTINVVGGENEKVKLQFQAPGTPGKYTFALFIVPDCYLGLDRRVEFSFVVHPAPELPPVVDEIFSDEEVSISDDEADDDDDDDDDK